MIYSNFDSWYKGVYIDKAPVVNAARSFSITNKNKRAVLCIHGYAGYPGELVHPSVDLSSHGFDVYTPRLPGMGTSGKDFLKSNKDDWFNTLKNALDELTSKYDEVSLVGHSMGSLLALKCAKEFNIKATVLTAPALKVPSLNYKLLRVISIFRNDIKTKWQSNDQYNLAYENAPCDDQKLGKEYWSHLYPKKILDLAELIKEAENIDKINGRVLLLGCEKDSITDSRYIREYVENHPDIDCEYSIIKKATHYVYYDILHECQVEAVNKTVEFLTRQ